MGIPENIDAFRAFGLCLGIDLPHEVNDASADSLDRLCDYLQISPAERRKFGRSFAPLLKKLRKLDKQEPEWLEFPERMKTLSDIFIQGFGVLEKGLNRESIAKLQRALESPRLPPDLFMQLVPAFLSRFSPPNTKADLPRALCSQLLALHPRAFYRALQACDRDSEIGSTDTAFDPKDLEPLARIMDRLQQAEESDHPRRAIDAALQAWKGAFEDAIFKTCLFLWYMTKPLDTPLETLVPPTGAASRNRPDRKPEVKKGQVFQEARDWCIRQGLEFPFHSKLDKIRHAIAHEDYTVLSNGVELRGPDGVLETFSLQTLANRVRSDIEFAFYFRLGANEASMADRERFAGQAWTKAVELLPELANITIENPKKPSARRS